MDMYRLMAHAQQVEETRHKRKNKEFKRAKSYEGGTSKGRLDIQDKTRLKKRNFNQVPSKLPKARKYSVSNHMSKKPTSRNSPSDKQCCTKCDKKHLGECLVG